LMFRFREPDVILPAHVTPAGMPRHGDSAKIDPKE